jgi:outer membrane protein
MKRSMVGACVVVGFLVTTGWCSETQTETAAEDKPSVYVGGGAMIHSQPYIGTDARVYPVPLFAYEGKRLYFRGVMGGYWMYNSGGISVGPVIRPRFEGYDGDDSSELEGMDDREWSVDGGAGVSWLTDIGLFGVTFVTDLLGRHNGQELDFSYTILFKWAGIDVIPSAGLRWKSANLVDYYYGVEADEIRFDGTVSRGAYEGNAAVDPYLQLAVRRKLGDRWSLLGAIQYEWFDSEITDSPIVEDDYEASFLLGVLYTW